MMICSEGGATGLGLGGGQKKQKKKFKCEINPIKSEILNEVYLCKELGEVKYCTVRCCRSRLDWSPSTTISDTILLLDDGLRGVGAALSIDPRKSESLCSE